ncbi:YlxQ family RNA-binding protein [Bacillus carboniphilus]|uniref:YlxQ family RNA-binding protein n=1 Tax=Bacillus carboniphilus TaxID=86663 RepID=A0ABY9K0Y6_9BACI|nr:YlxQ family RNA-binding protein [Bacillus carboniphilus]WLR43505.1 YlxQ family RNA-binding protein [Bacillus carboniphilus]
MSNKKWMSLLGLAYRANKVISGEELVIQQVRNGRAHLVLLSNDASQNTRKKVLNKCAYYQIPVRFVENRLELGQAIGKEARVTVGILDSGFASKLCELLD